MIVDIHTHTFPDKIARPTVEKLKALSHTQAFSDGTVDGLARSMARFGVDASLVLPVATNERQVIHVNDASARLNDRGPETNIWSFGCMHPDFPGWKEELSRVAALGMRGIKLHPVYQGVDLDDIRYLRILDRCGELGLAVLTHAGLDIGYPGKDNCSPEMGLRAVKQVGPVKLILAHMGGWQQWDRVEELLWDTEVCLDTAYALGHVAPLEEGEPRPLDHIPRMGAEQFVRMVGKFGARRIFFGTDSPWYSQGAGLRRIRELPLERWEREAILGGNAQTLLGI